MTKFFLYARKPTDEEDLPIESQANKLMIPARRISKS